MKKVLVCFPNSTREYLYETNLKLIEGAEYKIVADNDFTYSSPVIVLSNDYKGKTSFSGRLREITKADIVSAPPRKRDIIKSVYFNKKKGITTVVWIDNTKTMVECSSQDKVDMEKAILACFMKRRYDNRGYYNEYLRKAIKNIVEV